MTDITCPILHVRGGESETVSDEVLGRMLAANPRLRSVDVGGAGHVVTVDKPQEFNKAVAAAKTGGIRLLVKDKAGGQRFVFIEFTKSK